MRAQARDGALKTRRTACPSACRDRTVLGARPRKGTARRGGRDVATGHPDRARSVRRFGDAHSATIHGPRCHRGAPRSAPRSLPRPASQDARERHPRRPIARSDEAGRRAARHAVDPPLARSQELAGAPDGAGRKVVPAGLDRVARPGAAGAVAAGREARRGREGTRTSQVSPARSAIPRGTAARAGARAWQHARGAGSGAARPAPRSPPQQAKAAARGAPRTRRARPAARSGARRRAGGGARTSAARAAGGRGRPGGPPARVCREATRTGPRKRVGRAGSSARDRAARPDDAPPGAREGDGRPRRARAEPRKGRGARVARGSRETRLGHAGDSAA